MTPAQKDAALKLATDTKAKICDAYCAVQSVTLQLSTLLGLLPEGATKETVKGLLAVYTPMVKRLDGVQAHGEMNVYRTHSELPAMVGAIRPVVDPAPVAPTPAPVKASFPLGFLD